VWSINWNLIINYVIFNAREELERLQSIDVLTKLTVTFSRLPEVGGAKYVQDSVVSSWRELGVWILDHKAAVYICG